MTVEEFDLALTDLETRVDRLRALYENWFRGYEKSEPTVPRKDVERRVYGLRKDLPRNTALRFRYHQLYLRYTTMSNHWQRTARQIEEGTYRPQLERMRRKQQRELQQEEQRGKDRRQADRGEEGQPEGPRAFDLDLDESLNVDDLLDDLEMEEVARAIERPGPHSEPPPPTKTQPKPQATAVASFGKSARTADSPVAGRPVAQVGGRGAAPLEQASAAPATGTRPGLPPGPPRPAAPGLAPAPAPGTAANAGSAALPRPGPGAPPGPVAGPSTGTQNLPKPGPVPAPAPGVAREVPPLPAGAGPGTGSMAMPRPQAPPAPRPPALAASAAQPPAPARPELTPAARPETGVAAARPASPTLAQPASAVGRTAAPAAGPPAVGQTRVPAAPVQPPRPAVAPAGASGAGPRPAPAAPSGTTIGRPAPVAAQRAPAQGAGTFVGRPPTASPLPDPGAPDELRLKRIYEEYTAARRRNNEGEVRYEAMVGSIQKMLPELSKKHQGKRIDFEVVVKDGRVGLKPKAT